MDLSMFTLVNKLKYAVGKFLPIKSVRKFLKYDELFEERAFYFNHREYKPKKVNKELAMFSFTSEKYGLIKSYIRLNTSDIHVFREVLMFDKIFKNQFKDGNVIIDAGANIGLTSIVLSKLNPTIRIIALEPDDENFKLFKRNIELNLCKNIEPLNKALWTYTGELTFGNAFRDNDSWSLSVVNAESSDSKTIVSCISLLELIDKYHISNIDYFKIDIEGAEKDLFEDEEFLDLLKHKCKKLAIEVHEEVISLTESISILENLDFKTTFHGEHLHASKY